MHYTDFLQKENVNFQLNLYVFLIFSLKNRLWVHRTPRLAGVVLTSTHNLCFGATIRKKACIPLYTPVSFYNNEVKGGIYIRSRFPDVIANISGKPLSFHQKFRKSHLFLENNYPFVLFYIGLFFLFLLKVKAIGLIITILIQFICTSNNSIL